MTYMLLLNMSRVQQTVVLDLRTLNILISVLLPISSVATKDLSFQRQSKNTKRYTEKTLHRRKIEMVNAPLLVQQFTHPVHPNNSYRLLYLIRQFL